MAYFFISHSSIDGDFAHRIYNELLNNGHRGWIAPQDIQYGKPWPASIVKAIKDHHGIFLLLLSQNANDSLQVLNEVLMADNSKMYKLVFIIGDLILNQSLEYLLALGQRCQCENNEEDAFGEIIDVLLNGNWRDIKIPGKRLLAIHKDIEPPKDFIDREYEEEIGRILNNGQICTLHGEGGMGKSCLVKIWYDHNKHAYNDIIFVNAETRQDVIKSLGLTESEMLGNTEYLISNAIKTFAEDITHNNETDKVLVFVDNLSYDRGVRFEGFEMIMSNVINGLQEDPHLDIIVTTRLNNVLYDNTEMIRVGDLTEEQALAYLKKDYKYPFDEKAAKELIHRYGIPVDQQRWKIPVIKCVAIKNAATLYNAYEIVANMNNMPGTGNDLKALLSKQLKDLFDGNETERLFAKILIMTSFLDGGNINVDLLRDMTMEYAHCTQEQFDECLASFDRSLTLLNFTDREKRSELKIHRVFQRELNQLIIESREKIKDAIVKIFLQKVRPYSYYGTQTLSDTDEVMQHVLAFHEIVKKENNSKDYYGLLRAASWYYGYKSYDYEIFKELSDDLQNQHVSDFDRQLGAIDREIVLMMLRINEINDAALRRMHFGIERNPKADKSIEAKLIYIRYQSALAFYMTMYGTDPEETRKTFDSGEKACREMIDLFNEGDELPYENVIFVTEALADMYCSHSRFERINGGENRFKTSVEYADKAMKCLENEGYLWSLEQLNMDQAESFLRAMAINLKGVALMEENKSLENQYKAEELNMSAKDEYLKICYLPGIANQEINSVNIFNKQANIIIDTVNDYIRKRGEPASPEEWKTKYESCEILPGLKDRDGKEKSVAEWIKEYKEAVFQAKEQRKYSRITRSRFKAPVSEGYYEYMIPLATSEIHYNAYTDKEKHELLLKLFDEPGEPEGQDGLEKALRIPGLGKDARSLILRYRGCWYRHRMTFSNDRDEINFCYGTAKRSLKDAVCQAEENKNESSKRLAENELKKLEAIWLKKTKS